MQTQINTDEDISNHKNYKLEYEHWLADLKDPAVQDNISKNFQPAQVFDEQFTDEEMLWIYGYAFSHCQTVRHNDNGTMFVSGNLQGVYEKFKDKIDAMIPGAENSPVVGGNYFITPNQYGLHNDSTRESDWVNSLERTPRDSERRKWVPWRNMIIPIYTAPSGIESHGVFFDQRHIDFAHVYYHGKDPERKIATTYPIITDNSNIDFHLVSGRKQTKEENLMEYNKSHWEQYLYYTPRKRLTGLTPQLTCEWKPKCPIVFDAVQLHATNMGFKGHHWTTKMGLLLTFLREVK